MVIGISPEFEPGNVWALQRLYLQQLPQEILWFFPRIIPEFPPNVFALSLSPISLVVTLGNLPYMSSSKKLHCSNVSMKPYYIFYADFPNYSSYGFFQFIHGFPKRCLTNNYRDNSRKFVNKSQIFNSEFLMKFLKKILLEFLQHFMHGLHLLFF